MEPITVKYKVLDSRARTPAYATPGSAAADLCAVLDEPLTVQPMQRRRGRSHPVRRPARPVGTSTRCMRPLHGKRRRRRGQRLPR